MKTRQLVRILVLVPLTLADGLSIGQSSARSRRIVSALHERQVEVSDESCAPSVAEEDVPTSQNLPPVIQQIVDEHNTKRN